MKRIPVLSTLTDQWRRMVLVFGVLGLWTIAVFGFIPSVALGAIPQLINFQGQLKDGSGNPVPNGSYSVAVRIYDEASGINPALWSDTFSVSTTGGLFNVVLGSEQPLPSALFSSSNRWVGVQVGGDPEASPRTQLTSVPYSARVGTVDGATGGVISGDVSIQSDLSIAGNMESNGIIIQGGLVARNMALGTVNPGPPFLVPLLLQGAPGQSANLMEIKDGVGASMVSVQPDGSFEIKQGLFKRFAVFGHATFCGESLKVDGDATFAGNFQTSGISEVGGQDALISLSKPAYHLAPVGIGTPPSTAPDVRLRVESGATLHELGHNLGVRHLVPTTDDFFQAWDESGNKVAHISTMGHLYNTGITVEGAAGQTDNLTEWVTPLPGGGEDTVAVVNSSGYIGVGTAAPHSTLQVVGSMALRVDHYGDGPTDCQDITLDETHSVVLLGGPGAPGGNCAVNLPSAVGIQGRTYLIKKIGGSASYTVYPFPGQTIDGNASYFLSGVNQYVWIISDGANWWITGNNTI